LTREGLISRNRDYQKLLESLRQNHPA
jgi:hypothetical protein